MHLEAIWPNTRRQRDLSFAAAAEGAGEAVDAFPPLGAKVAAVVPSSEEKDVPFATDCLSAFNEESCAPLQSPLLLALSEWEVDGSGGFVSPSYERSHRTRVMYKKLFEGLVNTQLSTTDFNKRKTPKHKAP